MNPSYRPTLVLTPVRAAAPASGGSLEALIRVQAPERPPLIAAPQRQPLRLAVVVDRSGSMNGEPLREALRCTEYIAGGLQAEDQFAMVVYDDTAQVRVPLSRGGDAKKVHAALATVESGGCTALFRWLGGWCQMSGRRNERHELPCPAVVGWPCERRPVRPERNPEALRPLGGSWCEHDDRGSRPGLQ